MGEERQETNQQHTWHLHCGAAAGEVLEELPADVGTSPTKKVLGRKRLKDGQLGRSSVPGGGYEGLEKELAQLVQK